MASKELKGTNGSFVYDGSGINNKPTFNLNHIARYSSLLNPLLEKIIEIYDSEDEPNNDEELPDPEDKLDFNNVRVFSEDIIDCISFLSLVEEQIDTIDDEKPGSKKKFRRSIHQNYKTHRRELLVQHRISARDKDAVIAVIKENSDHLIQQVTDTILENAKIDFHGVPIEYVRDSVELIICYGFINCKILEKPNDYK